MTARFLARNITGVIIALGVLSGTARAQPYMVYPYGQTEAVIIRPGDGQTGGYGRRTDPGTTIFVPKYQSPQQQFQPNPAQQNWQLYRPGNR
jgi:hypothetical protein